MNAALFAEAWQWLGGRAPPQHAATPVPSSAYWQAVSAWPSPGPSRPGTFALRAGHNYTAARCGHQTHPAPLRRNFGAVYLEIAKPLCASAGAAGA
jgi:hypothetical protein